jgi:hypothetical protein
MFNNCDTNINCSGPTPGRCVQYFGPDIPTLGIRKGDWYDDIVVDITNALVKLINENYVDLKCLFDGCGLATVTVPVGLQKVIDFLCQLNTDDVKTNSSLFCLGGPNSLYTAQISNRTFRYNIVAGVNGYQFTYNFGEVIDNLPPNIQTGSFGVEARSNTGLITSTTQSVGGFNLPLANLPATIKVRARLNTPDGQVEGVANISLTNFTQTGALSSQLNFSNIQGSGADELNQTQYNEQLAAALCQLKQTVDSLQDINITNCDYLEYPTKDYNTVLNVQGQRICELKEKFDNILDVEVEFRECDDSCGEALVTKTLLAALNALQDDRCQAKADIEQLKEEVKLLKEQIVACCGGESGSGSGGSSGGGGGCIGGNCPQI